MFFIALVLLKMMRMLKQPVKAIMAAPVSLELVDIFLII